MRSGRPNTGADAPNVERPLRVGIFTPTYPGISSSNGGIGTYSRAQALALARLGHSVHVLVAGEAPRTVKDGDVTIHVEPCGYLPVIDRLIPGAGKSLRAGVAAQRLVRAHGLDVFEFPNWDGFGLWFGIRSRIPFVVRLSTSSRETQLIDGAHVGRDAVWDIRRERWQCRMAARLVTHSVAHRSVMAQELGVDVSRIDVVPLGIELPAEQERPVSTSSAPTVVFLGRLEKRKGVIDLIHAMPRVLDACPSTRFVLIGQDRPHCPGGISHQEYVERTFPPHLRQAVAFAGPLPDDEVTQHLRAASLFVAPSLYESFGLVFLEAMSWGTPVIGTVAGGIPEIIDHGDTGILVPPADHDALSAAIIDLLLNPSKRLIVGTKGRQKVEREFSAAAMARRIATVYAQVVAEAVTR